MSYLSVFGVANRDTDLPLPRRLVFLTSVSETLCILRTGLTFGSVLMSLTSWEERGVWFSLCSRSIFLLVIILVSIFIGSHRDAFYSLAYCLNEAFRLKFGYSSGCSFRFGGERPLLISLSCTIPSFVD